MKLPKHALDCAGMAVIPGDDALGCVAAADEIEFAAGLFQLTGDLDEQGAAGSLDTIETAGLLKHLDALVE